MVATLRLSTEESLKRVLTLNVKQTCSVPSCQISLLQKLVKAGSGKPQATY